MGWGWGGRLIGNRVANVEKGGGIQVGGGFAGQGEDQHEPQPWLPWLRGQEGARVWTAA